MWTITPLVPYRGTVNRQFEQEWVESIGIIKSQLLGYPLLDSTDATRRITQIIRQLTEGGFVIKQGVNTECDFLL